jgi:glutamate synthase (ferredoxin)
MRWSPNNWATDHDACGVGFVARLGPHESSREVIDAALEALQRLAHRGGVDADGASGDGAGLLLPVPEAFFRKRALEQQIELPAAFGIGVFFLPREEQEPICATIAASADFEGVRCLGWRDVPVRAEILGPRAFQTQPVIRQAFFAPSESSKQDFELQLFRARKRMETQSLSGVYVASLSSRTVIYKGLLAPLQLPAFYADLESADFQVPFAVFHQRYSTNTQPTWRLAQPFRFIAHNGEINTIVANRRWLRARESELGAQLRCGDAFRALEEKVSDSASFDNAFEILLRLGFPPEAAMLRLVPPAWESDLGMAPARREYLAAQAAEQEPWDGPAALVFTDGNVVGAKLDRNGLRPLRYTKTADGLFILGSEAGLATIDPKKIIERGRLGPGEMLLVDPAAGKVLIGATLADQVVAHVSAASPHVLPKPRARIVRRDAESSAKTYAAARQDHVQLQRNAAALGWTDDQFRILFQPLGIAAKEAVWSMGDDAPPAFLSGSRRPLWDYCKQRFAQVTNPAIDPLRESHVMSLQSYLGAQVVLDSPLLDAQQLASLEQSLAGPIHRIDITFPEKDGVEGAIEKLRSIRENVRAASAHSPGAFLLTDRCACEERAALPALLATATAWKEMTRAGAQKIPLLVETGQVVETHHTAMLIAAGATAVHPWLALDLAESLKPGGAANYLSGVEAGLKKVLARMGVSTISSYRNSQLFELLGLDAALCQEFFEDANAILGGKSLEAVLADALERHAQAFAQDSRGMQDAGLFRFRLQGEQHASSPALVRSLHKFIRDPRSENYEEYSALVKTREPVAVRDLLDFVPGDGVPIDAVEPSSKILQRFSTQAMSLGALSPEAHRTLAIAMNRLGARSNTGEGGEDPELYKTQPEATNRVKQVASARFGVTTEYLARADELEIKMAQGSKPGEGGQIPGSKVAAYIARLRHAAPGMALISPPPHHDIYSIEDLAQLIHDLHAVNPRARIGVKLVSGAGVGIIAAGVAKAGADVITISGFDGGTGASPLTSIKNTGLPWEFGLRDAHTTLLRTGFRSRVRLRVDGGFKSGRDVVVAALLGADEYGFGTAALLAIGCVMARQCHLNTCPVGIATQDEAYRARFAGKPEMVISFFTAVAQEVRELLAALGASSLAELVGKAEKLRPRNAVAERAFGSLLNSVEPHPTPSVDSGVTDQNINVLLAKLAKSAKPGKAIARRFPITTGDRSVGARLSGELARSASRARKPAHRIECEFRGVAGQSFGAFLASGVNFRLIGEANDYVGKGLSGGKIVITAGPRASRRGDVLAGNTILYGATGGELYIAGRAGERFAVRNSGALAVVEGVGQHACEYMTAGIVIVLGSTGSNFGAGMTGGLAYVLDDCVSASLYHSEFLRASETGVEEESWLRRVLSEHYRCTGSARVERLLDRFLPLPLMRLEPHSPPWSLEENWLPIIGRLERPEPMPIGALDGLLVPKALARVS